MTTAILIDGAYLDAVCKWELQGQRVDFASLLEHMANGDSIASKTYYHCPVWLSEPPSQDERRRQSAQRSFFALLTRRFGFSVKLGKTTRIVTPSGDVIFGQRKVDVLMAVDLLSIALSGSANQIALLSGNPDLAGCVRIARRAQVPTTLWHSENPKCMAGAELKSQANDVQVLTEILLT